MNEHFFSSNPQPDLKEIDDKLALFMDKDTLQMTIDHCVMKGIAIPEVRQFTEPEFRIHIALM